MMTLAGSPEADEVLVGFRARSSAQRDGHYPGPDERFRRGGLRWPASMRSSRDLLGSGRATLCSSFDDSELYDRAFTAWFAASA